MTIAGLAMRTARTPPHAMFVLPMADGAALALARAVHDRGEVIGGLNGSLPAAQVCAAELARLQGGDVEVAMHTRLFELGELVPPRRVPGRLRTATLDDFDLVREWVDRFLHDADVQAGRVPDAHGESIEPEDLRRRIERGTYWFWLDETGERVHLTGANPPAFGVVRIGPVYTPPQQRRKGYAGAAVAAVSQLFLDAGARVCLYTDQANPTSNGILAHRIPMQVAPAAAPLAQVNPLAARGGGFIKLFSTHPPTEERVARLEAMVSGR